MRRNRRSPPPRAVWPRSRPRLGRPRSGSRRRSDAPPPPRARMPTSRPALAKRPPPGCEARSRRSGEGRRTDSGRDRLRRRCHRRRGRRALDRAAGGLARRPALPGRANAAAAAVLATGAAAALWRRTSNPRGAIGAGPVLAAAAGAELADLEFCQFHPTALALPGSRFDGLLITEAVRGEGATLLDASGRRFTDELAPRDAVHAAILDRIEADGGGNVRLDLRELDFARFPNVFESLREAGLDPHAEPVPVAPAAHYTMGGIAVDLEGRSSLPGLFAVGECSCTGLHGANRLASNSLSECFVFGCRADRRTLCQ